jgi:hypothetical protein
VLERTGQCLFMALYRASRHLQYAILRHRTGFAIQQARNHVDSHVNRLQAIAEFMDISPVAPLCDQRP